MTKRTITLVCETCAKEFKAHAHRRVVHCQECAKDLRSRGRGPRQIQRKGSVNLLRSGSIELKEISWERAEADLAYYLKRFNRFPTYDGVMPSKLDQITDEDRRIANKIAARMSAKTWAPVIGRSIAQMGDWDLLNMTNLEWQRRKEVIREVFGPLLGHPGIGVARLTKALHRKRPKLIPICDSVVLEATGAELVNKADTMIGCMERLRVTGREQLSRLRDLRELSKQLHSEMTELRILELLYWVQFGPFPPIGQEN